MQTEFIQYEASEGIATITLNRPEAANAQTMPMLLPGSFGRNEVLVLSRRCC